VRRVIYTSLIDYTRGLLAYLTSEIAELTGFLLRGRNDIKANTFRHNKITVMHESHGVVFRVWKKNSRAVINELQDYL